MTERPRRDGAAKLGLAGALLSLSVIWVLESLKPESLISSAINIK
jgi:hypothetical protein